MVSSLALFDRLKKEVPSFVEGCASKGLVYHIPHTATQVGGIVGGNGLYKASAFGPTDGSVPADNEEEKRKGVEARIVDLAERGGWHAGIDKTDESIPVWQRRGFNWTWQENGDLEVVHRVPGKLLFRASRIPQLGFFANHVDVQGVRMHPTQHKPAIFNVRNFFSCMTLIFFYSHLMRKHQAMSTRYTNAKVNDTWEPPHTVKNGDGTETVVIPPHVSRIQENKSGVPN